MSCPVSVDERKQINFVLDLNPAKLKLKIYIVNISILFTASLGTF